MSKKKLKNFKLEYFTVSFSVFSNAYLIVVSNLVTIQFDKLEDEPSFKRNRGGNEHYNF